MGLRQIVLSLWVVAAGVLTGCATASSSNDDGGAPDGGGLTTGPDSGSGSTDAGAPGFDGGVADGDGGTGLVVTTRSLSGAAINVAFTAHLQATGGTTPYRWALMSGVLPAGLAMSADGTVSGTPTGAGAFSFVVQVTDSSVPAQTATASVSIEVTAALALSSMPAPPAGDLGQPYSFTFLATGGRPPYTFSAKGAPPAGLTLSSAGVLSGTPTEAGRVVFNVQVDDSSAVPQSVLARIVVVINGGGVLLVTTAVLPSAVEAVAYSVMVAATSGTTPYTWSVSAGSLPTGLTLSRDGVISGTPTVSGKSSVTLQVQDASVPKQTATADFVIAVAPVLSVSTAALPQAAQNSAYATTVSTTGGTAPVAFSLMSGALPGGLTLSSSGVISGTPTQAGTFAFVVTATDSSSSPQTASAGLSINVVPPLALGTKSLANGIQGTAYSQTLVASGGTQPYSFAVSSGALPAGLTLSAGGVLSGTPTGTGGSTFEVTVTDASSPVQTSTSAPLTVFVSGAGTLAVSGDALPTGVKGEAYAASLAAVGGTPAYDWAITAGSLPAGLSLSPSGDVVGTPSAVGSSTFTVQVTDHSAPAQSASASVTIDVDDVLVVTTAALPSGIAGQAYVASLSAVGGSAPYTWSVVDGGALPAGLVLTSSGSLTGTPTEVGTFTVPLAVVDGATPGQTANTVLSLTVLPALVVTTTRLPNGVRNSAYSASLNASGGTAPYTWSLVGGAWPAGLSMTKTGAISGTPTVTGSATVSVQVTDSGTQSKTVSFTFAINGEGTLTITSGSAPVGIQGAPYSMALTATGGTPGYSWSVSTRSLPPGLTLSSDGRLSGTPTAAGVYDFGVTVVDSTVPTPGDASQSMQVTVLTPLSITTTKLPNGVQNGAYSASLQATGATAPYSWSVASGSLPAGLTLDAATGVISGVPTETFSGSVTFRATDTGSPQQQATKALSLVVSGALSFPSTLTLPPAVLNSGYTYTFSAMGGQTPYAWSAFGSNQPPGLTMSSTGVLSGTPTVAGTFNFYVRVQDASSPKQSVSHQVKLVVSQALVVTTGTLPHAVVSVAYGASLAATGGNGAYSWGVASGALPTGLSLATNGTISGSASVAGSSNVTVRVTDSSVPAVTATKALTLTVDAAGTLAIVTTALPTGVVGAAYPATSLQSSGGTGPYAWSVTAGSLPLGLTMSAGGSVSGTPTAAGDYSFTVTVDDSASHSASRQFTVTVVAALAVTSPVTLPVSVIGVAYSQTLTSSGGVGPKTWSVVSGALPVGLTLSSDGVLSGTPAGAKGGSSFTLQVADAQGQTATQATTLNVDTAMTITTATVPDGTVNTLYSNTPLSVSGGTANYLWNTKNADLPPGMSLSLLGVLRGTPTVAGTYAFTVTVRDSYGQTADRPLSIVIH